MLSRNFLIWGDLPEELFYPMPFMRLVNYQVVSASTLEILQNVWRVSLFLGCIGLFTRVSALVACVLTTYLWTLMYGYSQEGHISIPLIFSMFVLAVSRSADGFSVDALLFHARLGSRKASPDYGWPARVICCIYVLMFFGSAISKIRTSGIQWGLHALTNTFYAFRLGATPAQLKTIDFFLNNFPMHWLGTGALLLELAAPLALFRGFLRAVILASLVSMQLVIYYTMDLDFRPTFGLIPFFVPWTNLRRALSEKVRWMWSQ
jgi:succinate dehydrogenase hydrophobic anchor subunit